MTAKELAVQFFNEYIELAKTDGRAFRATILERLKTETGCSHPAACTHYNNAKKLAAPVAGLGRAPVPAGVRRPGNKAKQVTDVVPDNECFSVIEIVNGSVGRCQSFLMQGDASEKFDDKVEAWPSREWVMIQGLGPNSGDLFKLESGEKEIKRHAPPLMTELIHEAAT